MRIWSMHWHAVASQLTTHWLSLTGNPDPERMEGMVGLGEKPEPITSLRAPSAAAGISSNSTTSRSTDAYG